LQPYKKQEDCENPNIKALNPKQYPMTKILSWKTYQVFDVLNFEFV